MVPQVSSPYHFSIFELPLNNFLENDYAPPKPQVWLVESVQVGGKCLLSSSLSFFSSRIISYVTSLRHVFSVVGFVPRLSLCRPLTLDHHAQILILFLMHPLVPTLPTSFSREELSTCSTIVEF
jgi:hypothetical protein